MNVIQIGIIAEFFPVGHTKFVTARGRRISPHPVHPFDTLTGLCHYLYVTLHLHAVTLCNSQEQHPGGQNVSISCHSAGLTVQAFCMSFEKSRFF